MELAAALDAANLREHSALLAPRADELCAAAADSKRLLELLKQCGVPTLGARLKAAAVIVAFARDAEAAPPPHDGFWEAIGRESAAATASGIPDGPLRASEGTTDGLHGAARPASEEEGREDAPLRLEKRAAAYPPAAADGDEKAQLYRERGAAAFARHDYGSAIRWYERSLALLPEDGDLLANLAACHLSEAPPAPEAAIARLAPLLQRQPGHVKARLRAGRASIMLGQLHAALTHYEAAFSVVKPKGPIQLRYAAPREERSDKPLLRGPSGEESSKLMQQAVEGKALASKLLSHTDRARALSRAGRVDEALYLARALQRHCTHSPCGFLLVVEILEAHGQLWRAQCECEEARRRWPGDAALAVSMARLLSRRGRVAEAEAELRRVVGAEGRHEGAARALEGLLAARGLKEKGNALYQEGEYEKAAACYSEAVEADAMGLLQPMLLGNRAQARLQGGRPHECISDCDAALALDAENVKLLLRRAAAHVACKQLHRAREDYAKVLEIEADNATAQEFLSAHGSGGGERGPALSQEEEPELDPYAIIGVSRDASSTEIKKAFLKGALKWHPDKHSSGTAEEREEAEVKFIQLNLANDVLSDPIKKQQYDVGGSFSELSGGVKRKNKPSQYNQSAGHRPSGFHNTHDERGPSMPST
ncbi:hypothetical protein AB1Y20_014768 [Prymnesium parvum]|uniref:J domain-containing protein n=1 Tax=Prymnesium parvum TaxID=97485 RepID=A0AB34IEK6_PRYPA